MADAGYPDGFEVNFQTSPILGLDITAEVAQAQLSKIGIKVNIIVEEWAQTVGILLGSTYEMTTLGCSFHPDCINLLNLYLKEGPNNWFFGNYHSPEIDALLAEGQRTTDVAKKQAILQEIYQLVQDDAGTIFLFNAPVTIGYRSELQGVEVSKRGDFVFSNNRGLPWITKVVK